MAMTLSKRPSKSQSAKSQEAILEETDFEALFQNHWERLCRLLYLMVGDMDDAQDLALEAYVQFYRRPPAEKQNLGGWLYRVATNLGLNALRARKRRQQYEQQAAELAHEIPPYGDPAEAAERLEEQRRVRAVLGKMKPRTAQILLLRHSGFSYKEIATALGVAPGSVGKLLARALAEFESKYSE